MTGDGTLRDSDTKSEHQARVSPTVFTRLVRDLEDMEFISLEADCGVRFSHGTFTSLEAVLTNGRHRVQRIYSYCDPTRRAALKRFADEIIAIADQVRSTQRP